MASGWFTSSHVLDQRAGSGVALPYHFAHLVLGEEHVALLTVPVRSNRLRRKDDLLDDGVAAIFRWAGADAELLGICFEVGQFTVGQAAQWLAERGFTPLLFVPNARAATVDLDAP